MRKAFICPTKYVQGENELLNLGYFVKTFGKKALLIADPFALNLVKEKLEATQKKYGVEFVSCDIFKGECSRTVVKALQEFAKANKCACTIGLGGGKAIDTSKCVAAGNPLIICPTIAATDAPTSHSAVLYTDDHEFDDYAYFRQSPSVVLIDLNVIANAPSRFLVSGMGRRTLHLFRSKSKRQQRFQRQRRSSLRSRPQERHSPRLRHVHRCGTCRALLSQPHQRRCKSENRLRLHVVTPAFEKIVETNILLSGLGFESGGLAAAHAIHDGLTAIHDIHACCMHGEVVAFGTICQLVLENSPEEELYEVLNFCDEVGLPVCLHDLMTNPRTGEVIREELTEEEYKIVAAKTCIPDESIHNMPFPVTEDMVIAAIKAADKIGHDFRYGCDCECCH